MSAPERLAAALADRYRIERELGEGGMATVYLAEDLRHHRQVAIKVMRPELAAVIGAERFLAEITTTAALQHPHILPLFDSGKAEGFLYYVMPFIDGETLRARMDREGQLPLDTAVQVAREVADALGYAHAQGIVHRDIKPENILLSHHHALVADFGIAKAVSAAGGSTLTQAGTAIGTLLYMSPEQAETPGRVDGRSDLYSLGCVLYEMLAGAPPYPGPTPEALIAQRLLAPPPDLRRRRASVPDAVAEAVRAALAKAPADRVDTAAGFAAALQTGTPLGATRRRPRPRQLLVAVVAVLVGVTVWLALPPRHTQRIAVLAPLDAANDGAERPLLLGMYGNLVTQLGEAGVLVVGGVQTMLRYQAARSTIPEIAKELGVDAVVEPTIAWTGDSVSVAVRVIDGKTESALWARQFWGPGREARGLLQRVARAVAGQPRVGAVRTTVMPDAPAVNAEAHRAYLQGAFYMQNLTPADLERAVDYFEVALDLDSAYAPAHAGLAWAWIARQQMGFVPPQQATPIAVARAHRAVALDSLLPEAHHALAVADGWAGWDWALAERESRRALELNPADGDARCDLSHVLLVQRRFEEAVAQADTALASDPLSLKYQVFRAIVIAAAARLDEASAQLDAVLRAIPNHPVALAVLAVISHVGGDDDLAIQYTQRGLRADGFDRMARVLEQAYPASGYRAAMRTVADSLAVASSSAWVAPMEVAGRYALAEDTLSTLEWLERALAQRDPNLPYISVGLQWRFLEGQQRFASLLQSLHLADAPRSRGRDEASNPAPSRLSGRHG